jgi:hypothetical protein
MLERVAHLEWDCDSGVEGWFEVSSDCIAHSLIQITVFSVTFIGFHFRVLEAWSPHDAASSFLRVVQVSVVSQFVAEAAEAVGVAGRDAAAEVEDNVSQVVDLRLEGSSGFTITLLQLGI